jgi:hypothetical protein
MLCAYLLQPLVMQYAITNDVIDRAWFSAREPMGCCSPIGGPGPYRLCCYPPAERVIGQCSEYGPQFFAGLLQILADGKLSLILQTAADQYVPWMCSGDEGMLLNTWACFVLSMQNKGRH